MAIDGISTSTASSLSTDYMQLLVAQLKNQNPLEPMDNNQMTSQLTSLSQLEQLESMNSNFGKMLNSSQANYAQSLIGKDVSFYDYKLEKTIVDKVSEAVLTEDGGVKLVAGEYYIGIDEVMSVGDKSLMQTEGTSEDDSTSSSDNTENIDTTQNT